MNCQSAPKTRPDMNATRPETNLLESIRDIRASIGDGLNDDELTRFLRQSTLPDEAGFTFLSFSDGFVTMTVPPQDPANWYPEKGWIVAEKERLARAIAEKYELSLCEPPDETSAFLYPRKDSPDIHHHLEFTNRVETVVIAHPRYLKIRLLGASPSSRYEWHTQNALQLGPGLLQVLSALYEARP